MKQKEIIRKSKFMRNKKSFFFLLILCLGIGFAFLTSNLTITGNTSVSGNKWSVYFDNVVVKTGSVDTDEPELSSNDTSLDFTVSLDLPGDYYEFTVDAINDGTIDAVVKSLSMTTLNENVSKYVRYTATYLDGTPLAEGDGLAAGETSTFKILVEYRTDINPSDLDESDVNLDLSFDINYGQSDTILPKKFVTLVKNDVLSSTGLDYAAISSASNGRGLYVLSGTETNENPIYYYRGAVTNNNAIFAGFCWKIVRTTDTGGTKLLYNGTPEKVYSNLEKIDSTSYVNVTNDGTYPYTFNDSNKEWENNNAVEDFEDVVLTFSVKEAGDYILNYNLVSSEFDFAEASFYKDEQEIELVFSSGENNIYLNNLEPSNVIKIRYRQYSNVKISMEKGVGNYVIGCTNTTGISTQLSSTTAFNESNIVSPAYNGYMYGTVYEYQEQTTSTSDVYGNTFTYENGIYTLSNIHSGVDDTHHYTCFNTTGTCSSLSYVYYVSGTIAYYINLTGGKSVEDAIDEMQTNTNNSTVKTVVDNWFNNTFKTYFTNNSKNYNDYLEDTVWCNDRSMNTIETDGTSVNNGWIPNGGSTSNYLRYSAFGRWETGAPTLACSNKNDSFTVTESVTGNGALTYPVGLLTADEIMLAGGQNSSNSDFYLHTNRYWWSMSPSYFYEDYGYYSSEFCGYGNGTLHGYAAFTNIVGARPSISLKPEVKVAAGGDGLSTSPYEFVVE